MSIDILSIGVGFETEGLVKGTAALGKAEQAANKTADAADKTTASLGKIGREAEKAGNSGMFLSESQRKTKQAMDDASGSIEKQIKAMQQQVALFGMSARQAELYKLALGGATDAQIKQANAALKSVETMEKARDMTEKTITAAKYGAAVVAAAVVATAIAWDKLIGSVAKYQDLAEQTGGDPAGLASLRTAADVGGVSIDSLAMAANRMQLALSKVDDESKGAGKALAAIGIEVEAFKQLRPDEQMRALGVALNQYADGGEKVAVIQGILGRGGAQMLSALKELGNEQGANNTLTNEQIALADEYKDAQARVKSELLQAAEVMAVQVLPALTALTGAAKDVILQIMGVSTTATDLERNKAIQEWAKDGALVVAAFADVLINMVNVARVVGASIRSVFADISLVATVVDKAGVRGAGLLFQKNRDDISKALAERNAIVAKSDTAMMDMLNGDRVTTALKKQFSEATRKSNQGVYGGIPASTGKPSIAGDWSDKAGKGTSEKISEYTRMAEAIGKVTAMQEQELQYGGKLTASAKFQLDEMQKINFALQTKKISQLESIKLTNMTTIAVAKMIEVEKQAANIKANVAGYADEIQFRKELFDAEENVRQARQRSTETLSEYSKAVEADNGLTAFELSLVGQTEEAKKREIALYRVEIELLKQKEAIKKNMPYDLAGQNEAFAKAEATAALAKAGVTSRIQLEAAEKSKQEQINLWKQIDSTAESVFMDIAKNGKGAFKSIGEELKNGLLKTLYDLTIKPLIIKIGTEMTGMDNLGSQMGGGKSGNSFMSFLSGLSAGGKAIDSSSPDYRNGSDIESDEITNATASLGKLGEAAGLANVSIIAQTIATIQMGIAALTAAAQMAIAFVIANPVASFFIAVGAAIAAIFSFGAKEAPNVLNDLDLFNKSLVTLPFQDVAYASDEAAQGLRDVLYGLENATPAMRKLAGDTIALTGDLMRARGDIAGARAYDRNVQSRGMSEAELALYDYNQGLRDQIEAAREGAAAAQSAASAEKQLSDARYQIAGKLNVLLGRQTQLQFDRATELAGTTDEASIAMLNLIYQLEELYTAVDASYAKLERSIAAEKKLADVRLKSATDLATALKTTKDAITPSLDRASAQSQIAMYVALAKAGGVLPTAAALKPALDSIAKPSMDLFKTFSEYAIDQARTANDIADLSGYADKQVSVEQQTIDRLDLQLDTAKQALDVMKGVDTSVMGVGDAVKAFEASMLALAGAKSSAASYSFAAPTAYSGGGGGGGYSGGGASSAASTAGMDSDIVAFYKAYYGRAPDQAGHDAFMKSGLLGDKLSQAILGASVADRAGADYQYAISQGYNPDNPMANFFKSKKAGAATTTGNYDEMTSFDVGSNYIPYDMNARIHQGEEITPKPFVDMQRASREESNRLMERLVASNERLEKKVEALESATISNANHNSKTASLLDDVVNGGKTINTLSEVAA